MGPGDLSTRTLALLAFLIAAAIYGQTLAFGFVFDDWDYVVRNPLVEDGLTLAAARDAFTTFHSSNWHPLTWLSHQLDVTLFGFESGPHHAANVLLHGLNGFLVFLALNELTRERAASVVTALLFLVHPLRVESVAWISERKDVLAATCFLTTLYAYGRFARGAGIGAYLAALVAFTLGALAKPMVVTLPCVLLVLDAWPLRRLRRDVLGRVLLEKLPFFAVSVGLVLVTLRAQVGAVSDVSAVSLDVRLWNALAACGFYFEKSVWPFGLTAHYPHPAFTQSDPLAILRARALLGGGLVLAGLVLGFLRRRDQPAILAGLLLFLGMLVPVIGFVQVGGQSWADRYAYLPTLWLTVAVVFPLAELARRANGRRRLAGAGRVVVLGAALLLALRSFDQARTWRDDGTLCSQALAHTDRNVVMHTNLGRFLLETEELERARVELETALAIDSHRLEAHQCLSILLERQGDLEGALRHAQTAATQVDVPVDRLHRLGELQVATDRPRLARQTFERVLARWPEDTLARYELGLLATRAGDLAQAEAHYLALLERTPDAADVLRNLGDVYLIQKRPAQAIPVLQRAIELEPEDPLFGASPALLQALAGACARTGAFAEAARRQARAVELLDAQPAQRARAAELLERYRAEVP